MRAKSLASHAVAAVIASAVVGTAVVSPTSEVPPDEAHFSPGPGPRDALIRHIDAAERTIRVQECELTSWHVGAALVRARFRGVDVRILLDRSDSAAPLSRAGILGSDGVPLAYDAEHPCYDAVFIIDDATPRPVVCLGPHVAASLGERDASSLFVSRSPEAARAYRENWERHARHSDPVRTPGVAGGPEPAEAQEMARGPIGEGPLLRPSEGDEAPGIGAMTARAGRVPSPRPGDRVSRDGRSRSPDRRRYPPATIEEARHRAGGRNMT
jgi:hypothetical protein